MKQKLHQNYVERVDFKHYAHPTVDYILTIYNEHTPEELGLLDMVLDGMCRQTYANIRFIVIYDLQTPQSLLDHIDAFLLDHYPLIYWKWSYWLRHPQTNIWTQNLNVIFDYLYNECRADYLVVSHSDDPPYPNRVALQLITFHGNPEIAFSMAGWNHYDIRCPSQFGFMHTIFTMFGTTPGGFPSCWMLDTKKWQSIPRLNINKLIKIGSYLDITTIADCLQYYPGLTIQSPLFQYTFYRSLNLGNLGKYWRPYEKYFNKLFPKLHAFIDWQIPEFWKKEIQKDIPIMNEYFERTAILFKQNTSKKMDRIVEQDRVLFLVWHNQEFSKPNHVSFAEWKKPYLAMLEDH